MSSRRVAQDRWLTLATLAVAALAIVLRIAAYDPWAQFHADEFFQYLEQGHRIAEGYGAVPWEWREGVRGALIPQLLSAPFWVGAQIAPDGMLPVHLARLTFAGLCLGALAGAWGIGAAQSRRHALVALLVAAVWFDGVRFSVYVLSESLATALIAGGAALVLWQGRKGWALPLAGLLLALGVLVRLQYAPFVAVFALLAAGRDWRMWRGLAPGAVAALALGVASDLAAGHLPLRWVWANFAQNIGEGRAARFGVTGPFDYLRMLFAGLGPFAPLILAGACFAGRRYWPLLAAAVVTIAAHSLIGHKEYRFIWLAVFTLLVLAAIASVNLADRWAARRRAGAQVGAGGLALLGLGWCGAALAALATTQGAASARSGGAMAMAAQAAGQDRRICALAVPLEWHNYVISAYLRRDLPLYAVPKGVLQGRLALPPDMPLAANAMLALRPPAPGWRAQRCVTRAGETACLFVRDGGCDAGKARQWERQAYMVANDL